MDERQRGLVVLVPRQERRHDDARVECGADHLAPLVPVGLLRAPHGQGRRPDRVSETEVGHGADRVVGSTGGYTLVILPVVKTAISLPDELFDEGERFAHEHGMTRSELYATALREFLRIRRRDGLVGRINALCEQVDTSLPRDIQSAARRGMLRQEW